MNRDKDFKDFVLREYRERGISKNEFKTFDEIKKTILSGHKVFWATDNYEVIIEKDGNLAINCNSNGFYCIMEQCEIPACYAK